MQIGIAGLGRMGLNMALRLIQGGHDVCCYNRTVAKAHELAHRGARAADTPAVLVAMLTPPRVLWLMLPSGEATREHIELFSGLLSSGDILIDGSNSFFKDDFAHRDLLAPKNIHYLDAGVSGGIWGLENGYCTMIGGERADFEHIEPLLKTLAPENGYLYCGPCGAGHFTKMIHNGIEYAMMQAYGEGFALLESSPYREHLRFDEIAALWNRGSVIRSWLLELIEAAFAGDASLEGLEPFVDDSGEGRWTVQQAVESGTPAPVIAQALFERFASRGHADFSRKILAGLRNQFGGHAVKATDTADT
jgi:6-phosphogluconate dehydrogenase